MAVSAVSAVSKRTTPVPRDLPLGSYWISACSTFPMVENSSTRSSLLVDQGNCVTVSDWQTIYPWGGGTHVPDVDSLVLLSARRGKVSEWVGWGRCSGTRASVEAAAAATHAANGTTSVASTAAIAESTTATAEASSAIAATKSTASTKSSAAAVATHHGVGKPVLADFKHAALPVVAVELLDCIASIVGALEYHNTGSLGSSIWAEVNISSNDGSSADCVRFSQQDGLESNLGQGDSLPACLKRSFRSCQPTV